MPAPKTQEGVIVNDMKGREVERLLIARATPQGYTRWTPGDDAMIGAQIGATAFAVRWTDEGETGVDEGIVLQFTDRADSGQQYIFTDIDEARSLGQSIVNAVNLLEGDKS